MIVFLSANVVERRRGALTERLISSRQARSRGEHARNSDRLAAHR